MNIGEILIVILLCLTLLKPKDIEILTKNIITIVKNLNSYFTSIKEILINSVSSKK